MSTVTFPAKLHPGVNNILISVNKSNFTCVLFTCGLWFFASLYPVQKGNKQDQAHISKDTYSKSC